MGWTALHCAVSNGQETTCKLLTEAGADALVKDSEGKTPMDLAKHFGNQASVLRLVALFLHKDVETLLLIDPFFLLLQIMVGMLEGAQDHAEVLDLKSLGIGERTTSSSQRSHGGSADTNQQPSPTSVTQPTQPVT